MNNRKILEIPARTSPSTLEELIIGDRNTKLGNTELHYAVARRDDEKVLEILNRNPAIRNQENDYGLSPLHFATLVGIYNIPEILIKKGASQHPVAISLQGYSIKCTPLQLAIVSCHLLLVANLLNLSEVDKEKELIIEGLGNVYHLAVLAFGPSIVQPLHELEWLIQVKDRALYNQAYNGLTPFDLAQKIDPNGYRVDEIAKITSEQSTPNAQKILSPAINQILLAPPTKISSSNNSELTAVNYLQGRKGI